MAREDHMEHTVPRASQPPASLVDVLFSLERLTKAIIGDPYDATAPPGMLLRQNAQEFHLSDLEKRLIEIEADDEIKIKLREQFARVTEQVRELVAREETARAKQEDRTATRIAQAVGMLFAALLGIIGTLVSKGANHP
jgi:hypothetical protein